MFAKTVAGVVLVALVIILMNVYREGGSYAVRSWLSAKLTNNPSPRPRRSHRPTRAQPRHPRVHA